MQIQLVGESIGGAFERGISQYPNIGDSVHIMTESALLASMAQVIPDKSLSDRYQTLGNYSES